MEFGKILNVDIFEDKIYYHKISTFLVCLQFKIHPHNTFENCGAFYTKIGVFNMIIYGNTDALDCILQGF